MSSTQLRPPIKADRSVVFSFAGAVAVSESPPFPHKGVRKIYGIESLLGTAGSSDTVLAVKVNGLSVGTVTLGSTVTSNEAAFTQAIVDTDVVRVAATSAGSGANDLSGLLRMA